MKIIDIQPHKKIGGEQYYTIKVITSINQILFRNIINAFRKAGAGYVKADKRLIPILGILIPYHFSTPLYAYI